MQEDRDAEKQTMQPVDPNATSGETLSDVEANESLDESTADSGGGATPSPDGQFDGGRAESVKTDPGPM